MVNVPKFIITTVVFYTKFNQIQHGEHLNKTVSINHL